MKDPLKLLQSHLRMLPYAVTFAYPFGSNRGLRASNLFNKGWFESQLECTPYYILTKDNLKTRINPLYNGTVRHIRRQSTHMAGGAELELAARQYVVSHIYR
jgi:hypothetical protein